MKGLSSFASVAAVIAAAMLLVPRPAVADLIPTAPVSELAAPSASPSPEAGAAERLQRLGLSPQEIETRLAHMTSEEVRQAAENPERIQVAGLVGWEIAAVAAGVILVGVLLWWLLQVHEK